MHGKIHTAEGMSLMGENTHIDPLEQEYGFRHRPLSLEALTQVADIRLAFLELAKSVREMCPDGRAKSLALTNLQQAKMWAVQSVVDG